MNYFILKVRLTRDKAHAVRRNEMRQYSKLLSEMFIETVAPSIQSLTARVLTKAVNADSRASLKDAVDFIDTVLVQPLSGFQLEVWTAPDFDTDSPVPDIYDLQNELINLMNEATA